MGRKAPVIVTRPMVEAMRPGSVIVDLASDAGGNCEATVPGEAITRRTACKILGYHNWPGRIPVAARALYARNLLTFLTTFWDKEAKAPKLPPDDEIVNGVLLTRGGAVVHPKPRCPPQAALTARPSECSPDPTRQPVCAARARDRRRLAATRAA